MAVIARLEAEAIYAIRETVAEFTRPVLLYSIGKDSSVLLELARRAFSPARIPFPLLHIDTGFKFPEMIRFRDATARRLGVKLIVRRNREAIAESFGPEDAHTEEYVYYKKTKPLLEAIAECRFDAAIGGARREEERARAKERIFSVRHAGARWSPRDQRAELWHLYNTQLASNESMRVFPLSNWTESDVWRYIRLRGIEVVPLYFAETRRVLRRRGVWLRVDEFNRPNENEPVVEMLCRYRTLGCSPSTGAVPSSARTVDDVIEELSHSCTSERATRSIDHNALSCMEHKKVVGYF